MQRVLVWIVALGTPAFAQFPGDVYFENPAPTFGVGEPVTLTVRTFTGTVPFGAVTLDLQYDTAVFRVDAVIPLGASGVELVGTDVATSLGSAVAIYNGQELTGPFGTVDLFRIVGEPLFPGEGGFQVDVGVRRLIDPDGLDFAQSAGFGAFITITDTPAVVAPPGAGHVAAPAAPREVESMMPLDCLPYPWRTLVRPGMSLFLPAQRRSSVLVRTYDPDAPPDVTPVR